MSPNEVRKHTGIGFPRLQMWLRKLRIHLVQAPQGHRMHITEAERLLAAIRADQGRRAKPS